MRRLGLLLLLTGCVEPLPYVINEKELADHGTKRFHASSDEVRTATMKALERLRLPVAGEDRSAETITTACVDGDDRYSDETYRCRRYVVTLRTLAGGDTIVQAQPKFFIDKQEISAADWNARPGRERQRWDSLFREIRAEL